MGFDRSPVSKSVSLASIKSAQARSLYGVDPVWLHNAANQAELHAMRDRGYAFCLEGSETDQLSCEAEQDRALAWIAVVPQILHDQRAMDRSRLTGLAARLADHPQDADGAQAFCRQLYRAHGGRDARILWTCFGNLVDGGVLVPAPIP